MHSLHRFPGLSPHPENLTPGRKPFNPRSSRRLITVQALADLYGVHRNTMRGRIRAFGHLDRHNVISICRFVAWIEAFRHQNTPTPPTPPQKPPLQATTSLK